MHRLFRFFAKPQISLRTGLVLFIGLCFGFGGAGRWLHTVRSQAEAQRRLFSWNLNSKNREGIEVFVAYAPEKTTPAFLQWCRRWVHPGAQQRIEVLGVFGERLDAPEIADDVAGAYEIESVQVICGSISPRMAAGLFAAPGLKKLHFNCDQIEAEGGGDPLFEIAAATKLEKLVLKTPGLSLEGAWAISQLSKLRELSIHACGPQAIGEISQCASLKQLHIGEVLKPSDWETQVGEARRVLERAFSAEMKAALARLAEHSQLESLDLGGLYLNNPFELHDFCRRSRIKTLRLRDLSVNAGMLEEIATMQELEVLQIDDESVTVDALTLLSRAPKLKSLMVSKATSDAVIESLRMRLKGCKVQRW
jgi:hypothetical protein